MDAMSHLTENVIPNPPYERTVDNGEGAEIPLAEWKWTSKWPEEDVDENEAARYTSFLRQLHGNSEGIREELFSVAKGDYPRRTRMVSEFIIHRTELNLHSDALLSQEQALMQQSALDVALMYDSRQAAEVLIQHGGKGLLLRECTDGEYRGATVLHHAIVKGNRACIKMMFDALDVTEQNWLLNKETNGSHFDDMLGFNGLPLSLAAVCGQKEIFEDLVKYGANIDAPCTKHRFNVFHSLVAQSRHKTEMSLDMIEFILNCHTTQQWWIKKQRLPETSMEKGTHNVDMKIYLLKHEDNRGYTPLKFAAAIHAPEAFEAIVSIKDVYMFPQWKYGPTSFVYYDMEEIDPVVSPKNKQLVLPTILNELRDSNAKLFGIEPVKTLIEAKWLAYRYVVLAWAILHCLIMIGLTYISLNYSKLSQYIKNNGSMTCDVTLWVGGFTEAHPQLHIFIFILMTVACVYQLFAFLIVMYKFLSEVRSYIQSETMRRNMTLSLFLWLHFGPFRMLTTANCFSMFAWVVFYMCSHPHTRVASAFALFTGWATTYYFTFALRSVGLFSVTMLRTVTKDLLPFLVIFGITNIAYAASLLVLKESTMPLDETLYYMLKYMVGVAQYNLADNNDDHYALSRLLMAGFIIMGNIQLINMLIAAMGDTYETIRGEIDLLFLKLRTGLVFGVELLLPPAWTKKTHLHQFWQMSNGETVAKYYLPAKKKKVPTATLR